VTGPLEQRAVKAGVKAAPRLPANVRLPPELAISVAFANRPRVASLERRYNGPWFHVPNEGSGGRSTAERTSLLGEEPPPGAPSSGDIRAGRARPFYRLDGPASAVAQGPVVAAAVVGGR
jgi:hypothetical protein